MMPADPTTLIAALGIEPIYSAREAATLLGRSYSWLDQGLRDNKLTLPDGTEVEPSRTAGRPRGFPPGGAGGHRSKQLQTRLVLDGEAEAHVPRAAYSRPPRHRRVQDPNVSACVRAARGGGQCRRLLTAARPPGAPQGNDEAQGRGEKTF